MSEFTKGPWVSRSEGIGVVDDSDTQEYGMLMVVARVDEYDFKSQSKANANLIASAPDLYDALLETIEMIERQEDFNDDGDGLLISRCRAALTKARGKK